MFEISIENRTYEIVIPLDRFDLVMLGKSKTTKRRTRRCCIDNELEKQVKKQDKRKQNFN